MAARAALSALLLAAAVAAGPAAAASWLADDGDGRLVFTATQAGGRFEGSFRRFRVRLDFDAAAARGLLEVQVETASADTADAERDAVLHGEDFFWSGRHPEARYVAREFARTPSGFVARGELTLRGVTRPLALRFTLAEAAGAARMQGAAELSRLAFGVGQGEWISTEWVGDPVGIAFDLSLRPAAAGR